jgi:hypothetical protein
MKKIYLTENEGRNEPSCLQQISFVHVKCKTDCSKTIIVTENEIVAPNIVELTQEEAQTMLDYWIDEENLSPELNAESGEPIFQKKIYLGALLG